MRAFALASVVVFSIAAPSAAMAQRGRGGGGLRTGGGGARPAAAPARPAPANVNRQPSGGGFNLNHDVSSSQRLAAVNRPAGGTNVARPVGNGNTSTGPVANAGTVNRPVPNQNTVNRANVNGTVNRTNANGTVNRTNVNGTVNRTNVNRNVNANNVNVNRNVSVDNVNVNRHVVVNPGYSGPAWGWNRGVVWAPATGYWGGGFWGTLAISTASAAVYGSIVNSQTHETYPSYQIQSGSPGATLLSNYHLTQTQCGPPGLVVIYGPNNSVICANGNDVVSPGEYNLDSSNLTLVSR